MRLTEILFTEERNVFAPPRFALAPLDDSELVLYDADILQSMASKFRDGKVDPLDWTAGMVTVRQSNSNCLTALQVSLVAANPQFGGAGQAMYALASKHWDGPITSDRSSSSSRDAKRAWDKIAANPEFKRVSTLDNYSDGPTDRVYVDLGPGDSFRTREGPRTPGEVDDCPLPSGHGGLDLKTGAKYTGTDSAWKYTGPLDAKALVANHNRVVADVVRMHKMTEEQVVFWIDNGSTKLFGSRYKGPD